MTSAPSELADRGLICFRIHLPPVRDGPTQILNGSFGSVSIAASGRHDTIPDSDTDRSLAVGSRTGRKRTRHLSKRYVRAEVGYILLRYCPPTSNNALVICPSEQHRTASTSTSNTF